MSELCVYQVEDVVWNNFLWSDDHMVIHRAPQQPDAHSVPRNSLKKSWRPITNDFNSNGDITAAEDIQHEAENGGLLSQGKRRKLLEKDFDVSASLDMRGNEFWGNESGLDDVANAICNNSLSYTLDDVPMPLNDLEFFKKMDGKGSYGFLYYGLPAMGNFEDVDGMFRNCDSTYGVKAFKEDELGWYLTSYGTDEPGELEKSGLKPPHPDSNIVDNSIENRNSSKYHSTICSSFLSVATNNNGYSWTSEKPDSMPLVMGPSTEDSTDVILPKEPINVQESSYFMNQHIEDTSSPSTRKWIDVAEIDPLKSSAEFQDHDLNPHSPIHSPYQDVDLSIGESVSWIKCDLGLAGKQIKYPGMKYEDHPDKLGTKCGSLPEQAFSSNTQENSTMNPATTDISLEAANFHQLQLVMEKLDVRTRLRIRDSLCCLAHSAEQRHKEAKRNNHLGDKDDTSASFLTEEANSYMNIETDTNAINRAVANLLFHRPSVASLHRPG